MLTLYSACLWMPDFLLPVKMKRVSGLGPELVILSSMKETEALTLKLLSNVILGSICSELK